MIQVDIDSSREKVVAIDIESGTNAVITEDEGSTEPNSQNFLNRVWSGFVSPDKANKKEVLDGIPSKSIESPIENLEVLVEKKLVEGEELSPLEEKKKVGGEKPKKKSYKKPPKPPRPPRAPSMDAADQKLIREISDLAMLNRARIERMKALKRMKNAKSSSSNSGLFALVVTAIFCIVIIWQGFFPRGSVSFCGSPESSRVARGGFISVQFYKNDSTTHDSASASPNNVELMSGLDNHGGASRGTRYAL